jgi:hypothetical protein
MDEGACGEFSELTMDYTNIPLLHQMDDAFWHSIYSKVARGRGDGLKRCFAMAMLFEKLTCEISKRTVSSLATVQK